MGLTVGGRSHHDGKVPARPNTADDAQVVKATEERPEALTVKKTKTDLDGIWRGKGVVEIDFESGSPNINLCGDVAKLLDGVSEIAAPGVPGPLCVFGEKAFSVVAGKVGKQQAAVVAATRLGSGRVVAFGHTGYLRKQSLEIADTGRLMLNAARWVSEGSKRNDLRVGVRKNKGLVEFLRGHGVKAEPLNGRDWLTKLCPKEQRPGRVPSRPRRESRAAERPRLAHEAVSERTKAWSSSFAATA